MVEVEGLFEISIKRSTLNFLNASNIRPNAKTTKLVT